MRRRIALAVAAGLLALGVLAAVVAFDRPSVSGIRHSWGEVDANRTELVTDLAVDNGGPLPVRVLAVEYVVRANGIALARGASPADAALPPGGNGTVRVVTTLTTDDALGWLRSHLARGERTVLEIAGNTTVSVGGIPFTVPFREERDWRTDLAGEAAARLVSCPPQPTAPCVGAAVARWDTNGTAPALVVDLALRNPYPLPLPVGGEFALLLEGQPVVAGPLAGTLVPARGTGTTTARFALDEDAVRAWWPRHVAGCERSDAQVQATFFRILTLRAALDPVETRFACNDG